MNLFEEKFKSTTETYENNKQLLNSKIHSLKRELKETTFELQNAAVHLTNERNINAAITNSIKSKGSTISIEYLTDSTDSTSSRLALPQGKGNKAKK
jgi:hypothetical protein